jgi:hypothetical protein
MVKDVIVDISGNRYRYSYNPETKRTEYRGPVGDAPPISEREFQRWAVWREGDDMDPQQIEQRFDLYEHPEDTEDALQEIYDTVRTDGLYRSDYVLLPGHSHAYTHNDNEDEPITISQHSNEYIAPRTPSENKFVGEFDNIQEAIDAILKDSKQREQAWEKTKWKHPRDWVTAKAKKVKPGWQPERD